MSAERFSLDTNILVYSFDTKAGARHETAKTILEVAAGLDCWLTLQSLSEFYSVSTRKLAMPPVDAATAVQTWLLVFRTIAPSAQCVLSAISAAVAGHASYWDALLMATAAQAGCASMLTEDMHPGALIAGVRVVNPFGAFGLGTEAAVILGVG